MRWLAGGVMLVSLVVAGCESSVAELSSSDSGGTGATASGPGATTGTEGASTTAGSSGDPCMTSASIPTAWSDCTSPDGFAVCGGTHCSTTCPGPPGCSGCNGGSSTQVAECGNDAFEQYIGVGGGDEGCIDGHVNVPSGLPDTLWDCVPFNIGVLYALNGAGPDRLRYADWGLWQGGPLPTPNTCPTFTGFEICGGNCGGCPDGETCMGRSPLHPYGFCLSPAALSGPCSSSSSCTDASQACFVFTVEPAAQALADTKGFCVPQDACTALAANLPGGGKCVP